MIAASRKFPPVVVMPELDPGIDSLTVVTRAASAEWIAGSSPAMTVVIKVIGGGHA
jgi:hypothetical protein